MSTRRARPALSLKARAIQWLSMREHSRDELRRKLVQQMRKEARAQAVEAKHEPEHEPGNEVSQPIDLEPLLDELQAKGYLSDQRFAESRLRVRAVKHGMQRVKAELAQHGVELTASQINDLKDSEHSRAKAVWTKRFGAQPAASAEERAKQQRFLASRGFAPEVIRKLVRGD